MPKANVLFSFNDFPSHERPLDAGNVAGVTEWFDAVPAQRIGHLLLAFVAALPILAAPSALHAAAQTAPYVLCGSRSDQFGPSGYDCVLLRADGSLAVQQMFQALDPHANEGLIAFRKYLPPTTESRTNDWGYLDADGRPVVAPRYSRAVPFSQGLGAVCAERPGQHGCGFVDARGTEVIPLQDGVFFGEGFDHGLAQPRFSNGGDSPPLIDRDGKSLDAKKGTPEDDAIRCMASVRAMRQRLPEIESADNLEWVRRIRPTPPDATAARPTGYCEPVVRDAVHHSLVDRPQVLAALQNMRIEGAGPFANGQTVVQMGGNRWAVLDANGAPVFGPAERGSITPLSRQFSEGLLPVAMPFGDDHWRVRYMTPDGSFPQPENISIVPRNGSVPPDARTARDFHEGLAAAMSFPQQRYGFVDRNGKWIIAPRYGEVVADFRDGRAIVTLADNGGDRSEVLIDRSGREVANYAQTVLRTFPTPDSQAADLLRPCAIEGARYLSPDDRAQALASRAPPWPTACTDKALRATGEKALARILSSLPEQTPIGQWWPVATAAAEGLGTECPAHDPACIHAVFDRALSDPAWRGATKVPVAPETAGKKPRISDALRSAFRKIIRSDPMYADERGDLGGGWGRPTLVFSALSFTSGTSVAGRRAIMVSQDVMRDRGTWIFLPDRGGRYRLAWSGQEVMDIHLVSSTPPRLRMTWSPRTIAFDGTMKPLYSEFRVSGHSLVAEMDCNGTAEDEPLTSCQGAQNSATEPAR